MLAEDDIVYCQPKKASHVNKHAIIITKSRVAAVGLARSKWNDSSAALRTRWNRKWRDTRESLRVSSSSRSGYCRAIVY
jgi:hypothetical protein